MQWWPLIPSRLNDHQISMLQDTSDSKKTGVASKLRRPRAFDTYESKKHPESPRGLIFFVKFISYILRDLA